MKRWMKKSDSGKKMLKSIKQLHEFVVHPGKQPVRITSDCVVLSTDEYNRLKKAGEQLEELAALLEKIDKRERE